jgi:hypothetical protein
MGMGQDDGIELAESAFFWQPIVVLGSARSLKKPAIDQNF